MLSAFRILASLALFIAPIALADVFPSTYAAPSANPLLFQNATILTGDGERLDNASLYVSNGRIEWIGAGTVTPGTTVVDAAGCSVMTAPSSGQKWRLSVKNGPACVTAATWISPKERASCGGLA